MIPGFKDVRDVFQWIAFNLGLRSEHPHLPKYNFGEKADIKQAITDLGVEYSLVTDYTSLVIVREEVFQAENIVRDNASRVAKEEQARAQRANNPVQNNRQDTQQPMYNNPRPNLGGNAGGGAAGPWTLLVLLIPVIVRTFSPRKQ